MKATFDRLGILLLHTACKIYLPQNDKNWNRKVWANSAEPDQNALNEQSDQYLHNLSFRLHILDPMLYCINQTLQV